MLNKFTINYLLHYAVQLDFNWHFKVLFIIGHRVQNKLRVLTYYYIHVTATYYSVHLK